MAQISAAARVFALPELVAAITQAAADIAIGNHNFDLVKGAYTTAIFEPLPALGRLSRVNQTFHYTIKSAAFRKLEPAAEDSRDSYAIPALSWLFRTKLGLDFRPWFSLISTSLVPEIGEVDTRPGVGGSDSRAHIMTFDAQHNQPSATWRKIKAFASERVSPHVVINDVRFEVKAGTSIWSYDSIHLLKIQWEFKRDTTLGEVFDKIYELVTMPSDQLLEIERKLTTRTHDENEGDEDDEEDEGDGDDEEDE